MTAHVVDDDRAALNRLGYAQELKRGMGGFSNFAISFSIISILAGGFTSYWIGATFGGPLVVTIGWLIVGFFVLLVGMAMGECARSTCRRSPRSFSTSRSSWRRRMS